MEPVCIRCDHELGQHAVECAICDCDRMVFARTIEGVILPLDRAMVELLRQLVADLTSALLRARP